MKKCKSDLHPENPIMYNSWKCPLCAMIVKERTMEKKITNLEKANKRLGDEVAFLKKSIRKENVPTISSSFRGYTGEYATK